MVKEITTNDIQKLYNEKAGEEIREKTISMINYINNELKEKCKDIVRYGYFRVKIKDFDVSIPYGDRKIYIQNLKNFYTTWNITEDSVTGDDFIYLQPKEPLKKEIIVDLFDVKETTNEDVQKESRFDLMDIEDA